tara:strand:+ start:241 stop:855 length:615 start_codon:yes stop_codon:yes gene_type:complete
MKTLYPTPFGVTTDEKDLTEAAQWTIDWACDPENSERYVVGEHRHGEGYYIRCDNVGASRESRITESYYVDANGSPFTAHGGPPRTFPSAASAQAFADRCNEKLIDKWIVAMKEYGVEVPDWVAEAVYATASPNLDRCYRVAEVVCMAGETAVEGTVRCNYANRDDQTGEEIDAFGAALAKFVKDLKEECGEEMAEPVEQPINI